MPLPTLLSAILALPLLQQTAPDPRQAAANQANAQSDAIRHTEDLLERGDYPTAEPILAQLAATTPKDARILFDLGFTQEHNGHDAAAQTSYEAAIADDPTLAEPRVALGLLKLRAGQLNEGGSLLNSALALPSIPPDLKARALRALARLDQPSNPARARDELAQAIQLTGQQPGDAELTASLTAAPGNDADTEATYRRALAQNPDDLTATVELANLLQKQNRLPEAEALLTPALAAHPNDPRLVSQTAALDVAENKTPEALQLLSQLRSASPAATQDPSLTRLYAHLLLVSGDAAQAEPLFRSLAAANPNDPTLLDDLGSTLVRQQKFSEAQAVLTRAVDQRTAFSNDQAWADAAGHLAFAASRNHSPQVALQALQARATVLPNSPATLFLEATALDALHQRKETERAYRAFLAMANGKLPDEEFEARHRLVALEHEH